MIAAYAQLIRVARLVALLVFPGAMVACEGPPPSPPAAAVAEPAAAVSAPSPTWPIPAGWTPETFALPPDFAPEFPYHGSEDLRFMPGFASSTAPDHWSYDFVWWVDRRPEFDAPSIAAALTAYFRGLCTAVGGARFELDPGRYRADVAAVPGSEPPRIAGQVFLYDAFATGLPLVLNVELELRSCPASGKFAVVVALSPKDTTDPVWTALRDAAAALVCP